MLLNREEIEKLKAIGVITPFHDDAVRNCSYRIHAARAFAPESGVELEVGKGNPGFWTIEPAQALVVKTEEKVKMPGHLMGMYTQLNELAQQGLSLMNASLIEPLYDGPLSCQLVNFSRLPITIKPGDPIAKMTFHQLVPSAKNKGDRRDDAAYDTTLSVTAAKQPSSFLDIAKIEHRVRHQVRSMVWEALGIPAAVLGGLILIAAVEPWATNYVYTHSGVSIDSSTKEVAELREELKRTQDLTQLQADQAKLKASVDRLTGVVSQMQKARKP